MSTPIQITLNLFNRPFKVKVLPESEAAIRSSVKQINDSIIEYKKSFPGRDDFDYLAMSIMALVSNLPKQEGAVSGNVVEDLLRVERMLD